METSKWLGAAAGAALLAATGAAAADDLQGAPFDTIVVFGDSLTDAGNIALASGFPAPMRFTTNPGLTSIEYVGQHYGDTLSPSLAGGTDFAWGGAGVNTNSPGTPPAVPTITTQIDGYLAANASLDPHGLYSYWGGANDIFYQAAIVSLGLTTPTAAIATAGQTGADSAALVGKLHAAGAGTVLVFNLPDIGRTPSAQAAEKVSPGAALLTTGMTQAYNSALNAGLAGMHGVAPVNVYGFFQEVLENPGQFGITNITDPACTVASSLTCTAATLVSPNAASTYLFADGVHPTTVAQQALADLVISELSAPQQMSLLPEAQFALTSSGRLALEDEMSRRMDVPTPGVHVFADGGYANGHSATQLTDVAGMDGDAYLVTGEVSMGFSENTSAGLSLTVGRNRVGWAGDAGHFNVDAALVQVFAQYGSSRGAWLNVQGEAMEASYDTHRTFDLGMERRTKTADPDGWSGGGKLAAGYWLGSEGWQAGPFVSGEYQRNHVDAFAEHGSDSTAMTFADQDRDALVGKVGLALKGDMGSGATIYRPFVKVAYAHDWDADRNDVTAGLVSLNGDFTMPGYQPQKNWIEAGAGISAEFNKRWGASVAYSGNFASDDRRLQSIMVGLHAAF